MNDATQKIEAERIFPLIAEALHRFNVQVGYGSLASGADLLLAEALLARKGALNAVLAFKVEDFLARSVRLGTPKGAVKYARWEERFASVLGRSNSLSIVCTARAASMGKTEVDDTFRFSNRRTVGLALLKADELATKAALIAIYDGQPHQSVAGTAKLVEDAKAADIEKHIIPCHWRRPEKLKPNQTRGESASTYRPVLFLWITATEGASSSLRPKGGIDQLLNKTEELVRRVLGRSVELIRHTYRKSFGLALVHHSTADTIEAGLALVDAQQASGPRFRAICDFGPIGKLGKKHDSAQLSRLDAGGDIADLPDNMVVSTIAFAAEARLANGRRYSLYPVGRISMTRSSGGNFPLPSIPLYNVRRAAR